MKFSRDSYYALLALRHLARQPQGTVAQAADIADAAGVPPVFLAKILHKLGREGILRSHRGRVRGYALARRPADIAVSDVVGALDGADVFTRCIFWTNACSDDQPCPLHEIWRQARPQIRRLFEATDLAQMAAAGPRKKRRAR